MEAVGQLAGGIAHDFNNLLTAILGYAQLLSERPLGEAALAEVAEISRAAERAAALTRQLLAFSRQQVQKIAVFDLNDVVSDTESMLARLLGEDVRISKDLAPDLGRVKADPGQIEQVLVNLAVNARDAMPRGGTLRIETRNVDLDEAYVAAHPAGTPGPYVMLAVSDNGCGMDPATLARIFEPFFTTKPAGKGTGLGLATVYGIVKQSGGFVWVYSEPGHGSTFQIYLPRVEEQATDRQVSGTPRRKPPRGTETVLLVEDDEAVRRFVAARPRAERVHGPRGRVRPGSRERRAPERRRDPARRERCRDAGDERGGPETPPRRPRRQGPRPLHVGPPD